MNAFRAALSFLTILPVAPQECSEDDLARSVWWFPAVGLLAGIVVGYLTYVLEYAINLPDSIVRVLCVVMMVGLSGALHLDGLADSADGLLSHRPRERMLEIMRDSRIGTMGVFAIVIQVALKLAILEAILPNIWPIAVGVTIFLSRCAMMFHLSIATYAREDGLAKLFFRDRGVVRALGSFVLMGMGLCSLFVLLNTGPSDSMLMIVFRLYCIGVIGMLLIAAWTWYCRRRLGGSTGDTVGAGCEMTETIVMLTIALLAMPWSQPF